MISEDVERVTDQVGARLELLSGSTLLVTGTSGFLFSYLVETIAALNQHRLDPPCRVIAVDKLAPPERLSYLANNQAFRFLQHDATQPLELNEKVDWIIHGASIASPTYYRRYPLETIDVNVTGTRHMLELTRERGARGMLFLSTSEIYGDPDRAFVPTPEDYRGNVSCTGPRACYDESKRMGETLCMTYHRLYGTPVKIIRPFNVYGPGQRLDDRRIIPDLMKAARYREPLTLYSDGRASRSFCYVSDAIAAMLLILLSDAQGEAFNVGNDEEEISIRELARLMREIAGPPWLEIEFKTSDDADYVTDNPQRRCPDLTRIRSRFSWQPKVSLAEGLKRTLLSYEENAATSGMRSEAEAVPAS